MHSSAMNPLHQAPPPFLRTEGRRSSTSREATHLPGSRQALCLWLPTFELRLELVRAPELDATSVALLSPGDGTRRTLWQVSERGAESGVRPGQLVSQAISLCPSLTLLEPDPGHYDAAQEEMMESLMTVSPIVEPAGRGRIFLGMAGLEVLDFAQLPFFIKFFDKKIFPAVNYRFGHHVF